MNERDRNSLMLEMVSTAVLILFLLFIFIKFLYF
jgi:hypothetical protein